MIETGEKLDQPLCAVPCRIPRSTRRSPILSLRSVWPWESVEISKEVGSTSPSDQCLGLQEFRDDGEKGSLYSVRITEGSTEEVALELDLADGLTLHREEER